MTERKASFRMYTVAWLGGVSLLGLILGAAIPTATVAQTAPPSQAGQPAQAPRAGTRGGPPAWEWWNDVEVQRQLGLSADKVRRIHEIFTRRSAEVKPIGDEFMRALAELEKMTRDRVVDEATYQVQVVRVESLRSELGKTRTVMLYRLTRELTPEQFKKLQDLRDQRFGARGRSGAR